MATPVDSGVASNNSTQTPSFSPTGHQAGDLIIAMPGGDGTNSITPAGGSGDGWTALEEEINVGNHVTGIFYQILGSSPPSSWSFTTTAAAQNMGVAWGVFRLEAGEAWGDVISDILSGAGSAGDTTPPITSVGPDSVVGLVYSHDSASAVSAGPTGATQLGAPYNGTAFALAGYYVLNPPGSPLAYTIDWANDTDFHIAGIVQVEVTTGGAATFDVDFAATVPLASLAATVGHEAPTFDASFAASVPLQSLAASVGHTAPAFDVSFVGLVPLQSLLATIADTPPGADTVSFAAAVPLQSLAAALDRTVPVDTVSFVGTLPLQTLAAELEQGAPEFAVAFAGALPIQTLAAEVGSDAPTFEVTFAATLPMQLMSVPSTRVLYARAFIEPVLYGSVQAEPTHHASLSLEPTRHATAHIEPS